MRFDILTILPEMVSEGIRHSIIGRAVEQGLIEVNVVNLRDYTEDRHRTTDDTPCGGGGGMVMKVEPIARALDGLASQGAMGRVLLTDPQGSRFDQPMAEALSREDCVTVICGRYEGVDDRVRQLLVTDLVSIGDFVLTGGELPALVMVDAVSRLLPGVLGWDGAAANDTFSGDLLDYPQFTRPRQFRECAIPDILLNGDHVTMDKWRRRQQLLLTRRRRPDLWAKARLTDTELKLLSAELPGAGDLEPVGPPALDKCMD